MTNPFSPSQLSKGAYARLEAHMRRNAQAAAEQLAKTGDRAACFKSVSDLLTAEMGTALRLGKQVGLGSRALFGYSRLSRKEQDQTKKLAGEQVKHLGSWLKSSEPLQSPGQPSPAIRLDMYALSIHGAYQAGLAFGLLSSASAAKGMKLEMDDPIWLWVNHPGKPLAVCSDCLARARLSRFAPYSLNDLIKIGFPGSGSTRCKTRCRCHIQLIAGASTTALTARAKRGSASTKYYGVVDPHTLSVTHGNTVGSGDPAAQDAARKAMADAGATAANAAKDGLVGAPNTAKGIAPVAGAPKPGAAQTKEQAAAARKKAMGGLSPELFFLVIDPPKKDDDDKNSS